GMYVCGPTVYSNVHLGNCRTFISFDLVFRYLKHLGYKVRYVRNITDAGHLENDAETGEDRIAKKARLEQIEPMEVVQRYTVDFHNILQKFNNLPPSIEPTATGHIVEQIETIKKIIDKGLAYEANGSVYFDVFKFNEEHHYGKLSGRAIEDMIANTRELTAQSEKKNPQDFALWKRAEPQHIMRWPSPWSDGFPGWHLECTVMSTKYLGEEFDIHGGGQDLVFPHHECELAQARAGGMPFARTWMHWNMITLQGEKMAKSKDHFVTLEAIFAQYEPISVLFHVLRSHYQRVSDVSEESLLASAQGLRRLLETYAAAEAVVNSAGGEVAPDTQAFQAFEAAFADAMNDDLNTPRAVAALFDATREVRRLLDAGATPEFAAGAVSFFEELLDGVLGVPTRAKVVDAESDALAGVVQVLLDERQKARERRDFAAADRLRDRLAELGIAVEDSTEGSTWRLVGA